jgi:type VI secretion system protein ImpL
MNPMWIALLTVVFVVLVAAVWLLGWFLGLALSTKIWATVALVGVALAVCAAILVVRWLRARRIERGLLAQGAAQAANADPAKRAQILELQLQVKKAIAALKASRRGGWGRPAALGTLPWYVVVGPPGAGKTTLIRQSGLTFPLDQGAAYRGTGGTRNCDWWFTNDAILLDTAGRYALGGADEEEWFGFLDLLRKHRKSKPINGLLVAIGVDEIANAEPSQREQIAKHLRARINEVTTRLKVLVPVYVVFTKADLVPGFAECWDDLRKSERGQIWGATFPLGASGEPKGIFQDEFETLARALHGRTLRRLASERNPERRGALLRFPIEFGNLKAPLTDFVATICERNTFQETPSLRGVYFTSGRQDVRAGARVAGAMAGALGVQLPTPNDPRRSDIEEKSFFLTDLFFKVIFPDQRLAGATEAEKFKHLLMRVAFACVAMLTTVSLVLPAGCTFVKNRELVKTTAEIGSGLAPPKASEGAPLAASSQHLTAAEGRLRQLDTWRTDRPVPLRWGMYTGDELYVSLRDAYVASVARTALSRVHAELEERLRVLEASPVRTSSNYNRDFDDLKLYLMLTHSAQMDAAWAAPRLVRHWELTAHAHTKDEAEALAPHVLYVCELLRRGEAPAWRGDEKLVVRARSILAQVPQVERLYESLVRDANAELAPIRRESMFYGSVGPFVKSRNGVKVDGAYTKQGWGRVKALLGTETAKLASERWVLGETEVQSVEALGKLRTLYFERFKNAWRDFINDLDIVDPGSAEYALAELNAMSEPEWPYLRLIRTLSENVVLDVDDDKETSLLQQVSDKAKEVLDGGAPQPKKRAVSPVEKAFRPVLRFAIAPDAKDGESPMTGLAQWEALVAKLVGALTDARDAASSSDPKRLSDVFQEAFRATSALLSEQDGFTRPLLSPLLMQPITLAWANVVRDAGVAAGANWEVGVWPKWHEKLEGRYPFAASRTDASLEDFLAFFSHGQDGLWGFYDESLKATLTRTGNRFVPSRRFKSSIGYTAPFIDGCLQRGAEITDALFPPKSEGPAVVFDVNVHSVSPSIAEVTLEIDGVSRTYKNEPEQWLRVQWPGKSVHGARLRVRGAAGLDEEISRPGDFGLFRLLDAADVTAGKAAGKAAGATTLVASWDLRAAKETVVRLDIRPVRNENPLGPGFFQGYACPRTITAGR